MKCNEDERLSSTSSVSHLFRTDTASTQFAPCYKRRKRKSVSASNHVSVTLSCFLGHTGEGTLLQIAALGSHRAALHSDGLRDVCVLCCDAMDLSGQTLTSNCVMENFPAGVRAAL